MDALLRAIKILWDELPDLVDDDWESFKSQLMQYIERLKEAEPENIPLVRALILNLFTRYPGAHKRLVEVINSLEGERTVPTAYAGMKTAGIRTGQEAEVDAKNALLSSVTRYTGVIMPAEVTIGEHFALVVRVTAEPVSEVAKELELLVPDGERVVEVTVIARPNGLELVGSNLRHLRVPLTADSDPVHFELVGRQVGEASVMVDFFQGERYLATVIAQTYVKAPGDRVSRNAVATRAQFGLPEAWEDPDLLIRIYETRGTDGKPRYRFELTSKKLGLLHHDAGEVGLPQNPELWVNELMDELTKQARSISSVSDEMLARFGNSIYDRLCPDGMKRFYWERLHNCEDIQTVLLVSSEPWVPWEMVKPYRRVGSDIVEAPHWCERFMIGRWLNGQPPPLILPRLDEVAVIAPRDCGISADGEVEMLRCIGLSVRRVEARLGSVMEFLQSDGCPGFHIISHGIFNLNDCDRSELWLERADQHDEDTREKLYPILLTGSGLRFGKAKPVVFFNTCNLGRSGFNYWGLGGWAKRFVVDAGCSAFIAPFWEVEDERAVKFAEVFYTELREGKPIGEVVRRAREAIKQTGNPTWLAYCLYGHPMASLA